MKGIIFTEFFELVETAFSIDIAEEMLDLADPESGGIYTAVGNYNHNELVSMVGHLSQLTGVSTKDLIMTFGEHLFSRFTVMYPEMFSGTATVFDFIESVEGVIHVEVRKLYPDAELPTIATERTPDGRLNLVYRSPRQLGDVAAPLISGLPAINRTRPKVPLWPSAGRSGASGSGASGLVFDMSEVYHWGRWAGDMEIEWGRATSPRHSPPAIPCDPESIVVATSWNCARTAVS